MTPRLAVEYTAALTGASKVGLLELARTLRPYRDSILLVGGWVPYLLIQRHDANPGGFVHVGSIDIDYVVDPARVGEDEYATIVELITEVGWRPREGSRFSFVRPIDGADGRSYEIKVDFLTPDVAGAGAGHRHRPIQRDLQARTMGGAELALTHRTTVHLAGRLPGGADSEADIEMLDLTGCIGTKAIALGDRYKQKDAYDLVSVLDRYGTGVREAAETVRPFARDPRVAASLEILRNKFRSERSEGPMWYAEFLGGDREASERAAQRAFQLVREFGRLLD